MHRYTMTSMNVPEPVMSLAVTPKSRDATANFSRALNRFTKEDPTFKVRAGPTLAVLHTLTPRCPHMTPHSCPAHFWFALLVAELPVLPVLLVVHIQPSTSMHAHACTIQPVAAAEDASSGH